MKTCPMVSSRFIAAVILFLLLISSSIVSISVVDGSSSSSNQLNKERRLIGSRPPSCRNKCFNCRPCSVTLVVPPHKSRSFKAATATKEEEEGYYLLSWRCRCGNKLFDP